MQWSWRLGGLAGIQLRVHATFFLILVWVAFSHSGGGLLTRADLFAALAKHEMGTVEGIMRGEFKTADSHDMLEDSLGKLQGCGCQTLPVPHNGELVGLATAENLAEFLTIQTARRTAGGGQPLIRPATVSIKS